MSDPKMYIPNVCPVNFIAIEKQDIPQYTSRFIDDYWLTERLNRWQTGASYLQPWLDVDSIRIQVTTDQGAPQIQVVDCSGQAVRTVIATQKQLNPFIASTYIYEASIALTDLQGIYFLRMSTPIQTWCSEPIDIRPEHEPSLLIEFAHRKYYAGAIFETGYTSSIRVAAMLRMKPPVTKDTVFEDQILDLQMVKSTKFRLWELVVGVPTHNPIGIPDWMIDRLTDIMGCSSLRIDGRMYTRNEGFKWEDAENTFNDALKGYRGELREALNRNSKVFESTGIVAHRTTMILNVSSKGFADTGNNASSTLVTFENVE